MPRRVRDANLESRSARSRLKTRAVRYRAIEPGLHLGYRRGKTSGGTWLARRYAGGGRYVVEAIGVADDLGEADGSKTLDFWQAQERARKIHKERGPAESGSVGGPYKVKDAIADYLTFLETNRKTSSDVRYRTNAFVLPVFGNRDIAKLTSNEIGKWHRELAEKPPRIRTKAGEDQRHRELDPANEDAKRKRRLSANRCLSQLKAALNRAWREGKVASDMAWRRISPFPGVDAARVEYLSVEQAKKLVDNSQVPQPVHAHRQNGDRQASAAHPKRSLQDPRGTRVQVESGRIVPPTGANRP
jgi:hypothetical protein